MMFDLSDDNDRFQQPPLSLIPIPVRVRVHSERTSAAARPVAYYPRRPPTHRPAGMSAAAALQSMVVSAYPGLRPSSNREL